MNDNKYYSECRCPDRGTGLFREAGIYESNGVFYAKKFEEWGAKDVHDFNRMLEEKIDIDKERKEFENNSLCKKSTNCPAMFDSTNFHKFFENKNN